MCSCIFLEPLGKEERQKHQTATFWVLWGVEKGWGPQAPFIYVVGRDNVMSRRDERTGKASFFGKRMRNRFGCRGGGGFKPRFQAATPFRGTKKKKAG